jgi:predicted metal-dependent phosphoesterase TrpH
MPKRYIDLHCHSLYSDGTFSPAELIAEARQAGLAALALTDHDNHDGWIELKAAADEAGDIEVVPGIEISTRQECPDGVFRRFDVLAYLFDPASGYLDGKLKTLREAREERNARMIVRLAGMGIEISMERLREIAGGRVIGRPHFARAMMEKGYVRTLSEAFERYLGDRAPGYVSKETMTAVRAIQVAREAGGVCSLAHPGEARVADQGLWRDILAQLSEAGLVGLECHYPEHSDRDARMFLDLAKRFGLVATGGSDFHGANRPGVYLGKGRGDLRVPYEALEELRQRRPSAPPATP